MYERCISSVKVRNLKANHNKRYNAVEDVEAVLAV